MNRPVNGAYLVKTIRLSGRTRKDDRAIAAWLAHHTERRWAPLQFLPGRRHLRVVFLQLPAPSSGGVQ